MEPTQSADQSLQPQPQPQPAADGRPVVCVVGAGPGLGLASARAFAAAGYDVALVGRRESVLADLTAQVEADGHGVDVGYATVDVADPAGLTRAVDAFVAHTGRLDVLHHNVSLYRPGGVDGTSPVDLLADLAVGTASLLTAVRAALPALTRSGGSVVVTGGGAADHPMPGALTLGVQKAALRALLQAMAPELADVGVHAATLTVRGTLAPGTAFDPQTVAARLLALAEHRRRPRAEWTVLHEHTGQEPVTTPLDPGADEPGDDLTDLMAQPS